jgi:hypothetical protein
VGVSGLWELLPRIRHKFLRIEHGLRFLGILGILGIGLENCGVNLEDLARLPPTSFVYGRFLGPDDVMLLDGGQDGVKVLDGLERALEPLVGVALREFFAAARDDPLQYSPRLLVPCITAG